MKPFLKWAGNKYQIIQQIKDLLPPGNRLIEPFVGSGAVFLNVDYPAYHLADSNPDLIHLYRFLQAEGQAFIDFCQTYFKSENNCKEAYYALRETFNTSHEPHLRAALFLYLNKHGYNGLCRYNASGGFNVPFGHYKAPYFPAKEMLYCHNHSQKATFEQADFVQTLSEAKPGDVIYCDPPYVPLSETSNFTSYSPGGFGLKEQQLLADLAMGLSQKGVVVLLSNHNTPFTQQAYAPAKMTHIDVQRYISCQGQNRTKAQEVLALFS